MSGHWSLYRSLMVDQVCFLKDADLEHTRCKIIVLPSYSLKAAFLHQGNLEYRLIDIKVTLFDTATIHPAAIRNIHICINILQPVYQTRYMKIK